MAGAVLVLMFFGGHSPIAWALSICLFFLVQSLYFFIVSANLNPVGSQADRDPFEQAVEDARQVMNGLL